MRDDTDPTPDPSPTMGGEHSTLNTQHSSLYPLPSGRDGEGDPWRGKGWVFGEAYIARRKPMLLLMPSGVLPQRYDTRQTPAS